MQLPVDITFKEIPPSDAVTARINEWVDKLERIYDRIVRCEVVVETPHRHHRNGRHYHVRARLTLPRGELVASHDPGPEGAHEDVYVALRDTFTALRRQLEEHVRKLRRDVKVPVSMSHARVVFIDVERAWGRLEADDRRQIYFHRNSVLGGIDGLQVGDEVRFAEEQGDQGPQASTVEPIGANGHHALPAM